MLSERTGPLYQYKEVTLAQASLSAKCTDNQVCTDKFCTDSELDKGFSLQYRSRDPGVVTNYIIYIVKYLDK